MLNTFVKSVSRFHIGVIYEDLEALATLRATEFWMCFFDNFVDSTVNCSNRVCQFGMNDGCDDDRLLTY